VNAKRGVVAIIQMSCSRLLSMKIESIKFSLCISQTQKALQSSNFNLVLQMIWSES